MGCKTCTVRKHQVRLSEIEIARLARQLSHAEVPHRIADLKAKLTGEKAQLAEARGYLAEHEAECEVMA